MSAAEEAPRWLELPYGVRVQVRPLDALIASVASNAGLAEYQEERAKADDAEKAGMPLDPKGMNVRNQDYANALFALRSAQVLARHGIIAWENVVGADRQPLPVTPESVERFASHPVMRQAFVNAYNATVSGEIAEGNDSAPSQPGASAEGANTAEAAPEETTSTPADPDPTLPPAAAEDVPSSSTVPEAETAKPA
ncbi:hypothetical protein ACI2KH_22190 [Roseomonas mucosa]|uniref:hypothetical protein n=1 Tax=Roseomonas mucosa TaxID=207340 RepID=UPI00384F2A59